MHRGAICGAWQEREKRRIVKVQSFCVVTEALNNLTGLYSVGRFVIVYWHYTEQPSKKAQERVFFNGYSLR
jgi:hypothetical protein